MWMYFGLAAMMSGLLIISAGRSVSEEVPWYQRPFEKAAGFLTDKMPFFRGKDCEREKAKLEAALLILFAALLLMPFLEEIAGKREQLLESLDLARPAYGEGSSSYALEAQIGEEAKEEPVDLTLQERRYTKKEEEELLRRAMEEIDELLVDGQASRDEVRGSVHLPSELQDGKVTVQWIQNPDGLLDADGTVTGEVPKEGAILTLTALLSCEDTETQYETALRIYPATVTEDEQIRHDLHLAVQQAQENSQEEETLQLPAEVDGQSVTWSLRGDSLMHVLPVLAVLLAAAGYFGKEAELKKQEKEKARQILLDYPDIVFKLGMLLGAGLTIQNAFRKIAAEYKESRERGAGKTRWAYEEMLAVCNEMSSGLSEAKAYESFGRKCEAPCYVRLGTMLSGGLQKSANGMTAILLEESREALKERRQLAKKIGEEAGTKLLFPMILMLMVVLIILMVPAVMSF